MSDDAELVPLLEGRYEEARSPEDLAYVACARGRFDEAIALAAPLLDAADLRVRARARTTAGSALRQRGRYDDARRVERFDDLDDPLARVHLRISHAADAVGAADADAADRALEAATAEPVCAGTVGRRRASIRFAWVRAEIALLRGTPAAAIEALTTAVPFADGWPRHAAKTALFAAVAYRDLGDEARARSLLARAGASADAIGAEPIVRVARDLLAARSETIDRHP